MRLDEGLYEPKLHSEQDVKKMTSEVGSLHKMLGLIHMIIYSVCLTSWNFAYESNVFLSWAQSYANFKNQSIVGFAANYLCLVLLSYLDGFLPSKALI